MEMIRKYTSYINSAELLSPTGCAGVFTFPASFPSFAISVSKSTSYPPYTVGQKTRPNKKIAFAKSPGTPVMVLFDYQCSTTSKIFIVLPTYFADRINLPTMNPTFGMIETVVTS